MKAQFWFPVFRPVPGKFREGKQVYLCGRRNVYLDRYIQYVKQCCRSGPGLFSQIEVMSIPRFFTTKN
jgi:hypothetical protein